MKIKNKINKMNSKQRKVFYTCSVLGLLVLLNIVGLTYAWFSSIVIGNDTVKDSVVESGTLSIKYTNSNEIKGENILPGWSETKVFTIENTGTVEAHYNINWNNLTNEFINKSDLVYSITSDNNGGSLSETVIPETGEHLNILSNITIDPGITQTYTMKVEYKNRDTDQTEDSGKKLLGKLELLDVKDDNIASSVIKSKYSSTNTEGLIKLDQPATAQTPAQTEYRYSGSNSTVKNYVTFNDETWRIIGVFNTDDGTGKTSERLKLIREEPIGNYSWDTSTSNVNFNNGVNQWGETTKSDGTTYEGADLMRLLNPGYSGISGSLYWNKASGICYSSLANKSCDFTSTGLNDEAKSMIDSAKWYLAAINYGQTTPNIYISERGTTVGPADTGLSITKTNNWIGKVGLMNTSDYGYASSECYNSSTTLEDYGKNTCESSSWMHNSTRQWTLVPYSGYSYNVLGVSSSWSIATNLAFSEIGVRPVLYLKFGVKITLGDGTSSDPYQLSK